MRKRVLFKSTGLLSVFIMVSVLLLTPPVAALELERVTTWYWTSDMRIDSVAVGDVDGDDSLEITTAGDYYDGTRYNAQLCVWSTGAQPSFWNPALVLEGVTTWCWASSTLISSVAVGDVDGDQSVEIVTGGWYNDGARMVAQLCVWSGSTLALEQVTTWYWVDYTWIYSVSVCDVDGDGSVEVVTGGYYNNGIYYVAQLCVWEGATLALENVRTWYWTGDTVVYSVAVGDVDGDQSVEIVTGGYFNDGTRDNAQLCVWSGSTLALEQVTTWYWTSSAYIRSANVADVDGDGSVEVVTGGSHSDGVRWNSQLCVWSGSTLALENVVTWYWTSETHIFSVAVVDVDSDGQTEIVTGGHHLDLLQYAQLCVWDGSTLALEDVTTWYWTSDTYINSVAVGDVDGDGTIEVVTGGKHWDSWRFNAQLAVWIK